MYTPHTYWGVCGCNCGCDLSLGPSSTPLGKGALCQSCADYECRFCRNCGNQIEPGIELCLACRAKGLKDSVTERYERERREATERANKRAQEILDLFRDAGMFGDQFKLGGK